jgi:hypothetical protein
LRNTRAYLCKPTNIAAPCIASRNPTFPSCRGSVVGPSIPILKQAVLAECIIKRARLALDYCHGRDGGRDFAQHTRLEDTLRSHERNALPFVNESFYEHLVW